MKAGSPARKRSRGLAYFYLEEVLWRTVDLLEGLLTGLWQGLHDCRRLNKAMGHVRRPKVIVCVGIVARRTLETKTTEWALDLKDGQGRGRRVSLEGLCSRMLLPASDHTRPPHFTDWAVDLDRKWTPHSSSGIILAKRRWLSDF